MDCKKCQTELNRNFWISMQDTPKEIREHLERCPFCSSEFQWMIRSREAFSEIEQSQIPTNLHQTIMQALEPELILVKGQSRRNWFEFLQWKPVFNFAAASVLIIALAALRLTQPKPVQTMELLQPEAPSTVMRTFTKEGEAEVKDSMNMMTAPAAGFTVGDISELLFEVSSDEFALWEAFLIEKEIVYQRIELEKEEQLVIEGTGNEIVELRKEFNETLDSSQSILIHNFVLQSDPKAEKLEEDEATVLQLEQSYRITFQKQQK